MADNPETNKLGRPGPTEDEVLEAVSRSGYPLQTIVADKLRQWFGVQEEWSYLDRHENDQRSIDLLAEVELLDPEQKVRVRPALNLIVECKQSSLPFVFFLGRKNPRWIPNFPLFAGLRTNSISITSDNDPSSWHLSITNAFELDKHPFVVDEPEFCYSFSKCVRGGSRLELSGEDAFKGVVLPIRQAMRYFEDVESPPETAVYFDCHLVLGVGVLDAPMVGIRVSELSHEASLLPWVRVIRHETEKNETWLHRNKLYAIDVVHKDFLEQYVSKHVRPFSQVFSQLVLKHHEVLASGKGFAPGMGKNSWTEIERRLRPRRISSGAKRGRASIDQVLRLARLRKMNKKNHAESQT